MTVTATPLEAVEKYKKQTEESTKTISDWVDKHRKSNEEWNKLKGNLSDMSAETEKSKTSLDNLNKTTETTSTNVANLSKEFGISGSELEKTAKQMEAEVSKSFEGIMDSSSDVTTTLPADLQKAIDDVIKSETDLTTNTDTSMQDILKAVDDGTKGITEDFDVIKEGMTKEKWTFDGVAEGLKLTFKNAREAIKGEWNQIANTLNGEHEVGAEKVKIKLPKFARGGFPEDGLFMANHSELVGTFSNGKTAVANNAQIVDGISSGVYNAVTRAMSASSGQSSYISNEIIVDGDVIARSITKAQERQNRRYSPSMV